MKINQVKDLVDSWLKNYFKDKGSYEKIIYESMEYSVINGGKELDLSWLF